MNESLKRSLAVLLAVAVVSAGVWAAVDLGGYQQASPVGEADAVIGTSVGVAMGIAAGYVANEIWGNDVNVTAINTTDGEEAQVSIYQQATTQGENVQILTDSYANYITDARPVALMEGKNAVIRAYNNGSSASTARTRSKQEVADYYAARQIQLLKQWNVSIQKAASMDAHAEMSPNTSDQYIHIDYSGSVTTGYTVQSWNTSTTSISLANGSSYSVPIIYVNGGRSGASYNMPAYIGPTGLTGDGSYSADGDYTGSTGSDSVTFHGIGVGAPNSNYQETTWYEFGSLNQQFQRIETQNTDVQQTMDNFVNNTHSAYVRGQINNSDLIDPYLASREYSPDGQYGSFTLSTLSNLGVHRPANLSNVRQMQIQTPGFDYNGVLLSDHVPNGSLEIGQTYNASHLPGQQYVLTTDGQTTKLGDEFTVTGVNGTDGQRLNKSTVSYTNITYRSTNISDFRETMQQLRETQAQIAARQANLTQGGGSGGGGGLIGGFGGSIGLAGVAILAGAALLVFGSSNGPGGGTTIIDRGRDD